MFSAEEFIGFCKISQLAPLIQMFFQSSALLEDSVGYELLNVLSFDVLDKAS